MTPIRRLQQEARLSGTVVHGNTVFLAGQVADYSNLDAEGQTADILRQIDSLLPEAGTNKSRLPTCQIYISDMRHFAGMKRAWDAWLDPNNKPAHAKFEARLTDQHWFVEITGLPRCDTTRRDPPTYLPSDPTTICLWVAKWGSGPGAVLSKNAIKT
ncbi:MAG: RidA family protein [Acetobacteraceae bacterium]|nr:RidA family protein [Acetobacteraceae bacterium]MSP30033.1 RidA family protein [Acetobacteraceae bacterium]